jgi:hypothetical protein
MRSHFILAFFGAFLTQNVQFFNGKNCPNFEVVAFFSACLFFSDFNIDFNTGWVRVRLKLRVRVRFRAGVLNLFRLTEHFVPKKMSAEQV